MDFTHHGRTSEIPNGIHSVTLKDRGRCIDRPLRWSLRRKHRIPLHWALVAFPDRGP